MIISKRRLEFRTSGREETIRCLYIWTRWTQNFDWQCCSHRIPTVAGLGFAD